MVNECGKAASVAGVGARHERNPGFTWDDSPGRRCSMSPGVSFAALSPTPATQTGLHNRLTSVDRQGTTALRISWLLGQDNNVRKEIGNLDSAGKPSERLLLVSSNAIGKRRSCVFSVAVT